MKTLIKNLLLSVLLLSLFACGNSNASSNDKTIKVGATPTPHGEILAQAKPLLKELGYELEIKEFNDYVLPNKAVEDGELDANFFQHVPYMDNFNQENGTHIVSVGKIHYEPMGIFAGKTTNLNDLPDGASVLVPNDTTNEARALLLLQDNGLITLKDDAGLTATVLDIVDNPKNLKITEVEAAQITRSLVDVDIAVVNGNYAIQGGLALKDALATETSDSVAAQTYANVLSVKQGNENLEKIQALLKVLTSDDIKKFIEDNYDGAVVPMK